MMLSSATRNLLRARVPSTISLAAARIRLYASFPPHTVINMPALSPTMTQGNIGPWRKLPGDSIAPGDVLVEIETDKAQMDFEAQDDGFLAKVLVDTGAKDIPINMPIAVMVEDKANVAAFESFTINDVAGGNAPATTTEAAATPATSSSSSTSKSTTPSTPPVPAQQSNASSVSGRLKASPFAKTTAASLNVNLAGISGSGPGGRILAEDVKSAALQTPAPAASASQGAASPSATHTATASTSYVDIPVSNIRKVIATRLTESKQTIPHYQLTSSIRMDKMIALRQALNASLPAEKKLSLNDMIIKAVALALTRVPEVNSQWHGDVIRQFQRADICVATATPAGLITPIVDGADLKGLLSISSQVKDLVARARKNELKPHEFQGGTFTISNLGMFGIESFNAIINPPQACILAVGATERTIVPADDSDSVAQASIMKATLSCDHRVVDGAVGAQWMREWKKIMEQPLELML